MDQPKTDLSSGQKPRIFYKKIVHAFPDCDGELCAEENEEVQAAYELSAVAAAVPGRLLGEAAVPRRAGVLPSGRRVVAVVRF